MANNAERKLVFAISERSLSSEASSLLSLFYSGTFSTHVTGDLCVKFPLGLGKALKKFNEFSSITHISLILRIHKFKNTVLHKGCPRIRAVLPTCTSMAGGSALTGNSGSSHMHCEGLGRYYLFFLNLPIRNLVYIWRTRQAIHLLKLHVEKTLKFSQLSKAKE